MAASAHATATAGSGQLHPTFANAIAFDVTAPLRDLARQPRAQVAARSLPPERGPTVADRGFAGDGAVQATAGQRLSTSAVAIAPPLASFEGLANADNPFLVSPPDPVGDVGPNHYVEMVNLVFAVYSKTGARLLGPPTASFVRTAQLPVASFDSIFPCNPPPDTRDCIPQPGTTNKLDILSYRQRPTWRLAYRNFGSFDALVTNQSVEARPGIAAVRWYEIRNPGSQPVVCQQGTYAPDDGTHRWMGSVATDRKGGIGVGFSVSSETVFPGIRYTGRLQGDPAGQLPLGEAVLTDAAAPSSDPARAGATTPH